MSPGDEPGCLGHLRSDSQRASVRVRIRHADRPASDRRDLFQLRWPRRHPWQLQVDHRGACLLPRGRTDWSDHQRPDLLGREAPRQREPSRPCLVPREREAMSVDPSLRDASVHAERLVFDQGRGRSEAVAPGL